MELIYHHFIESQSTINSIVASPVAADVAAHAASPVAAHVAADVAAHAASHVAPRVAAHAASHVAPRVAALVSASVSASVDLFFIKCQLSTHSSSASLIKSSISLFNKAGDRLGTA
jgi:hypothetical protein